MLQGSLPALVTPFKNSEIDYGSLEKLLQFHLANESNGLVLLGTTAEASSLANDEKESLLRFCIQRLKGKLPIIVGTGSNNLYQTISQTQKAELLGGEYALIVTPYYNKPNQDGLYLYYREIVQRTTLPIIIYNVPSRTGCNISADTVIKLSKEFPKRIVAIKEASGDLVKATKIVRDAQESFSLLSGEDALNYPLLCIGARGAISVTANCVPREMSQMINAFLTSRFDHALVLHQTLLELNEIMFCDTNPIPIKVVLESLGLLEANYRLPLCQTTETKKEMILHTFKYFQESTLLRS